MLQRFLPPTTKAVFLHTKRSAVVGVRERGATVRYIEPVSNAWDQTVHSIDAREEYGVRVVRLVRIAAQNALLREKRVSVLDKLLPVFARVYPFDFQRNFPRINSVPLDMFTAVVLETLETNDLAKGGHVVVKTNLDIAAVFDDIAVWKLYTVKVAVEEVLDEFSASFSLSCKK
eukprot:Opistho-2@69479